MTTPLSDRLVIIAPHFSRAHHYRALLGIRNALCIGATEARYVRGIEDECPVIVCELGEMRIEVIAEINKLRLSRGEVYVLRKLAEADVKCSLAQV